MPPFKITFSEVVKNCTVAQCYNYLLKLVFLFAFVDDSSDVASNSNTEWVIQFIFLVIKNVQRCLKCFVLSNDQGSVNCGYIVTQMLR